MPQWLYQRVIVFPAGYPPKKIAGKWYLQQVHDTTSYLLRDKLYAASPSKKGLPLNPDRPWDEIFWDQIFNWLAWDDDAGYADMAMDIVSKRGLDGWELAGIQIGSLASNEYPISYYIFKKPLVGDSR